MFEHMKSEGQASLEADMVILNTFDELEGPVLDALRIRVPPLYSLGPLLHAAESDENRKSHLSDSIWTEETDCVKWLDGQVPSSVIYVCFGGRG